MVVDAWFTVWVSVPVEPVKLASPLYVGGDGVGAGAQVHWW